MGVTKGVPMALHPNLEPLVPLIGTWRGQGEGGYPTITSFSYADEWEFRDIGKPFLLFVQRTFNASGAPMHTETGYLRFPAPGVVEIVAALPTGQAELGTGTLALTDTGLTLDTDAAVRNTPSAKQVDRCVRRFDVAGDTLTYRLDMDAVDQGLTLHLRSRLTRA